MTKEQIKQSLAATGLKGGWLGLTTLLVIMLSALNTNVEAAKKVAADALKSAVDTINGLLEGLRTDVDDLKSRMLSIESRVNNIKTDLNVLMTSTLPSIRDTLTDKIELVKTNAANAILELKGQLSDKISTLETDLKDRIATLNGLFGGLKADILLSVSQQVSVALAAAQDNVRKWIPINFTDVTVSVSFNAIAALLEKGQNDAGPYVLPLLNRDNDPAKTIVFTDIPFAFMPAGADKEAFKLAKGEVPYTVEMRHGDKILVNYDGAAVTSFDFEPSLVNLQINQVNNTVTQVNADLTARADDTDAQMALMVTVLSDKFPALLGDAPALPVPPAQ